MGFRVIHYEGDKELLIKKIKEVADELKSDEFKDDFDFEKGEWEHGVDLVVNGDFSDPELASLVVTLAIDTYFPAISEDCGISAYEDIADRTSGKLAKTLRMFIDGRNLSTGNAGFGFCDEINCGYLTPTEVKEFLDLLKAYTPNSADEDEIEFIDILIDSFSRLAKKNSGDLFIMS